MATRKTTKGGLTGSKRFEIPTSSDEVTNAPQTDNSGTVRPSTSTSKISNNSVVSNHTDAFSKATQIASQFGIAPIEISALLGSDPYTADGNIPEMSAAEANQQKLKLQRQTNAIEVRHEKIKLGRKVVKAGTEQINLIGDVVDYATAGINTATKFIKNEIANVQFQTEHSKLTQSQELLTQQNIATEGTINLTEGIRTEWELKQQRQFAKNSGLKLEVEGAIQEIERKREELASKLIEA